MRKEDLPLDEKGRLRVRMIQSHNHELDCRIETLEEKMKDVIMKLEAIVPKDVLEDFNKIVEEAEERSQRDAKIRREYLTKRNKKKNK